MLEPNKQTFTFYNLPSINRITAQLTITGRKQNEVSRELFLRETFGVVDNLNHGLVKELYTSMPPSKTRLPNFIVTFQLHSS